MRLLNLPDALRAEGLEPILVDGWKTRGSELTVVKACLDHHTAGARIGYMPSLNVLINGRTDLKGPLCNVGAPRSAPGDTKVYVIASGKANHAGVGLWNGADSNYESFGLERELVGDGSDITAWRNEVAVRVHAAVCKMLGLPSKAVCRHAEYALPKGRKIDTAGISGDWLRSQVQAKLAVTPTPPGDDEMPVEIIARAGDGPDTGTWYVIGPWGRRAIDDAAHAAVLVFLGMVRQDVWNNNGGGPAVISGAQMNKFTPIAEDPYYGVIKTTVVPKLDAIQNKVNQPVSVDVDEAAIAAAVVAAINATGLAVSSADVVKIATATLTEIKKQWAK